MSFEFGFYNSVDHDRRYTAQQVGRIFDGIIRDGVYASIGNAFAVTAGSGMGVIVGTGRAWFNHTWSFNDAAMPVTIPTAHSVYNRIDAVVIEVDIQNRENRITVVKGVEKSSPTKPVLLRGEKNVWQYPLAYVAVAKGVSAISSANITPAVGTSECPFVTGVLQMVQVDEIVATWKNQFNELYLLMEQQLAQAVSKTIVDGSVTYQKLAAGTVNLFFENVTVPAGSTNWVSDTTTDWRADYPYRCNVPLAGVTEKYMPECIFAYQQVIDGNLHNVVRSYNGGISIWAKSIPSTAFTILQVEARRVKA